MADQELLVVVRMRDEASAVLERFATTVGKQGGALGDATKAVDAYTAAIEKVGKAAHKTFATLSSGILSATSNGPAITNMANAGLQLGRNFGSAATAARTLAGSIGPIVAGGGSIASQLGAISVKAIPLVGQLARVGLAYVELVDAAEPLVAKQDELMRRLSTFMGGQVAAEAFFKGIKDYANETGISIVAATEKAIQFAKAGRNLGISAGDTLGVAVTAEQLAKISGASPEEAAAAIKALQNALSSTKVEAADLKTILTAVPQISHQIARGLGVSVDELRRMVGAGTLTGRQISDALQKQSGEIDESFKQLPRSVAESIQRIANSIDDMMTRFAQSVPGVRLYQQAVAADCRCG